LQILCISGAFLPLYTVYQNQLLSLGKSDYYMWLTSAQIVIMLVAVLACHSMGVMTMTIAFAAINILWLLVWQVVTSRMIGYRMVTMLKDVLPFLCISIAVMGVTYVVTLSLDNLYLSLVARVVMAAIIYALVMKLSRAVIFEECINYLLDRFKRNRQ
jgi:O-antigen/teichoic acid export membrane protein